MKYTIIDIEANGLLNNVSKIHCLSYEILNENVLLEKGTLTNYEEMISFLNAQKIIVGHNIIRYDIPTIEKVLNIKITAPLYDTLGLSWYLYPFGNNYKHGLEAYGERFGFPKVKIEDNEWEGPLPGETEEEFIAKMISRCERDVEINRKLFIKEMVYLHHIYEGKYHNAINYISFKLDCLREQEELGITLDKRLCETELYNLEFLLDEKTSSLAELMPPILKKEIPKKPYKKDGSLSATGVKWMNLLKERNLPLDTTQIFTKGNPGSHSQLKSWLLLLGWVPETFKESKATGEMIPQVSLPFGGGICPSVKRLYKSVPELEELEGYFVAKHRLGIFKSFLESEADPKKGNGNGKVYATAHGFTNTLRLQHSKPVNL